MSFNITPAASRYQEIHPYSAMNIDIVKINTSLIMMKECKLLQVHGCESTLISKVEETAPTLAITQSVEAESVSLIQYN